MSQNIVLLYDHDALQAANETQGNGSEDSGADVWLMAYWASFIGHPEAQQVTASGVWLRLIILPVILLAGFLGNALTTCLMLRPKLRRHSYSPFLVALAACDSLALIIRLLFWANLVAIVLDCKIFITFQSHGACATVEYLCTANHVMCSWLVVSMTYERVIVVVFPLKSASIVNTASSAKAVVVIIVISLILLSYIPAIVFFIPSRGGCVIHFPLELYAHFALATTFVSILPLFLICLGNFVIVLALFQQSRKRAILLNTRVSNSSRSKMKTKIIVCTSRQSSKRSSCQNNSLSLSARMSANTQNKTIAGGSLYVTKEFSYKPAQNNPPNPSVSNGEGTGGVAGNDQVRKVTLTLLSVSLAFLVLVMPNALLVLTLGLRPEWNGLLPFADPFALLWDANFASNFYMFIITGAHFRAELFLMVGCTKGSKSQPSPDQNNNKTGVKVKKLSAQHKKEHTHMTIYT